MKKLLSGTLFLCTSALAAGIPSFHSATISGNYVEARTADVYTGPCFANSEVGLTGDLAVFGWSVTKGSWNGVPLDGLTVVGVVRAKSTLGDAYTDSNPAKAVLIIDSHANSEQRLALQGFARKMGGDLMKDIVRVEYTPVDLKLADNSIHSMAATLTAGTLAKIETRALNEGDHICHNESVWYQPLTSVDHAMAAFAVEHQFTGKGLGATWSSPGKRSAFVGSFSTVSE